MKDKYFKIGMFCIIFSWITFALLVPRNALPDLSFSSINEIKKVPNFAKFNVVQEKKHAFFDFLYPILKEENIFLLEIRSNLIQLRTKSALDSNELAWLEQLKTQYLIESKNTNDSIHLLLRKIDIIPPSLILSQAAIESGWGTSRFAKQANNLFGHWCFSKGCGVVPKSRDKNKAHEVAKFDTVNESVRAYLKNLNAFHRYEEFRTLRAKQSEQSSVVDVLMIIQGLEAYSEQGLSYIKKIKNVINHNNLQAYDLKFLESL